MLISQIHHFFNIEIFKIIIHLDTNNRNQLELFSESNNIISIYFKTKISYYMMEFDFINICIF